MTGSRTATIHGRPWWCKVLHFFLNQMQFCPFSTLPFPLLIAPLSWNIKTLVWQNRREMQGHKHVIHNPENLSSELEATKGWILQGNLLRVLDEAKDKADREEKKKLRFKQSIAEPLNWIQLQLGLQNITRHILASFVNWQYPLSSPVSHSCSPGQ